jgi:PST family polysaccharide transporter
MERMKYITYLNILAKSIFTVAIFVFVHEQSDFWIVPLLTSIGFIIAGIWSLILVRKEFGIVFEWQKMEILKKYFYLTMKIFKGQFSYSLIAPSTVIIAGLFLSNMMLGYFSIVEKLIRALSNLCTPLAQTIYPYLSRQYIIIKVKLSVILLKFQFFTVYLFLL